MPSSAHSTRTGQPSHTARMGLVASPRPGKNSSGSIPRHAASWRQGTPAGSGGGQLVSPGAGETGEDSCGDAPSDTPASVTGRGAVIGRCPTADQGGQGCHRYGHGDEPRL